MKVLGAALLAGTIALAASTVHAAPDVEPPSATALVRAAGKPDLAQLKALLRQGAPVNGTAPHGETPLQAAAAEGLNTNVFTLLTSGAGIDMLAGRGITALGWAARGGHLPVVRTLLDAGADVDRAKDPERAPIALAAAREHRAVVELLIERGSNVFGEPALAGAVMTALAQTTSVELADLVVPRVAAMLPRARGLRGTTAMAIAGSSVPMSQAILARLGEAGRSREFQTALLLAAVRRGRHDVASGAISAGADVNATWEGSSALALAIDANDAGMVQLLVTANADVHAAGVDAAKLDALAGTGLAERAEAERLAAVGEIDRLDESGTTLLFRAAQRGNFLAVKQLLDRGANPAATVVRWPGDSGWTPLMTAAAGNQVAVVELLLSRGAAVDQRNGAGRTALSYAAFYGRAAVVDLLLSAGADPLQRDSQGQSLLTLANASGDSTTIMRTAVAVRTAEAGAESRSRGAEGGPGNAATGADAPETGARADAGAALHGAAQARPGSEASAPARAGEAPGARR